MNRKGIIVLMICLTMLLSACVQPGDTSNPVSDAVSSPTGESEVSQPVEEPEFETVFRFLAASDIHVQDQYCTEAKRLKQLFTSAYAYAATQDYKTVDAFIVAGDFTNQGSAAQYQAFNNVVNENIKDETTLITVMGNHEYYGGNQTVYKQNVDAELDKHIVVKGYHFIGLSTHADDEYSQSIDWLSTELAEAYEDDPAKPIITFQHHHIKDTVYVSAEWYTSDSAALDAQYSKYSNVINFSGHSHGPVNNPTSVYQKNYTLFGTGTLSYFEMTSGMTYGTIPPNSNNGAQFYIVEVSADNAVRVMPYNLLTDTFFKTPSRSDGDKQLVYYIPSLTDKSTWLYTAARKTKSDAPAFAEGSKVTVKNITANSAEVEFPQADDDEAVYSYNITFTAADKTKISVNYFSEYYFEPMPETLSFTVGGLKGSTEYTVSITPYDAFGKKGEPIQTTVTTEKAIPVEYTSENDVEFAGTFTNFDSLASVKITKKTVAYGGTADGDVFVGDWTSASTGTGCAAELAETAGYKGSKALAVWSSTSSNQGLYIFATDENKNATVFPETSYLRVWCDFTDVQFRKANFGLVAPNGCLFTTDELDGRNDLEFYYLADGSDTWVKMLHGDDGCFGTEQSSAVKGKKGWFAFPVKDFGYRNGTGNTQSGFSSVFTGNTVKGVYLFWDYDSSMSTGTRFYLDELQFVDDYTAFTAYEK